MNSTKKMAVAAALAALAWGAAADDGGRAADEAALEKARAVLATLTLEEKVALTAGSGSMSLRVPGTDREWQMSDNSHTVRADMNRWSWRCTATNDEATVMPALSALASTWSVELAERFGHVIGEEARARGKDQMLGPGVNIMRLARCGRNWEYFSEDPCLTAKLAVPEIRAMQSHGVAATVKHFVLNDQELNRHDVDTVCSERALNEIYLPAFEAAVVDGGAWCVMTSYNKVFGDWASENAYVQRGILRDRWHFKGMVVTDWGGAHSTAKAALAGGNVEMNMGASIRHFANPKLGTLPLAKAVKKGEVPEEVVDEMALHTLWTVARAGFFDPEAREKGSRNTPEHQQAARDVGEEAITLLKNDAGVLPLDPAKTRKVLVVGKLAKTLLARKGSSAEGKPLYEVTPLMGIEEYFGRRGGGTKVEYMPLSPSNSRIAELAHDVAESALGTEDATERDAGIVVRAWEVSATAGGKTELSYSKNAVLAPEQAKADKVVWHTRLVPPESGRYSFCLKVVYGDTEMTLDGRKLRPEWKMLPERRKGGTGVAAADLEAGREYDFTVSYAPRKGDSHKMEFGWLLPSESGSLDDIRKAAEDADATLVFTGTELGRGAAMEGEGADRPDLKLPKGHDEAIAAMLSWNLKNFVVVTHSGSPLELPWADDAKTILQHPYLGQESGRPLARVLFGEVNPSGKLPCTWPRSLEDTPVARCGTYAGDRSVYNEGLLVGYRWYEAKGIRPLFAFGHGLSYTTFAYGGAEARAEPGFAARGAGCRDAGVVVSVRVRNTGRVAGKETVQVYVAPVAPRVARPPKELKGFAKASLAPGEEKTLAVRLAWRDFAYWDVLEHDWRVDPGEYRVLAGSASDDIRAECTVSVE